MKKKKERKERKKRLRRQKVLSLYPKFEHSKVVIQDVEFNNNGKLQDKHSFSSTPKHSEHLLLHAVYFFIYI